MNHFEGYVGEPDFYLILYNKYLDGTNMAL